MDSQANNPLHGVTLKALMQDLVDRHGWEGLAQRFDFACFHNAPSLKSSLKFLRKTPWARAKVEKLWVLEWKAAEKKRVRNARRKARRAFKASLEEGDPQALSDPANEE